MLDIQTQNKREREIQMRKSTATTWMFEALYHVVSTPVLSKDPRP